MAPRMHFISGLPRSGSTLLAGLLRQNPRFHAAMSGPVANLVDVLLNAMGPGNETSVFLDEERKVDILRSAFDAYYRPQAACDVIFDTNRSWCARLPTLKVLFPEAKVLCCVRNVAWILDSFEHLVRKNAFEPSRLFGSVQERRTVYSRVEALAHRDRVVGFAWSALKEAYYGEHSDMLLLVEYDLLAQRPLETLRLIYRFLGEEPFTHDIENVEYDEPEFDRILGAPGLHTVRRKVEHVIRQTVLPPDLFTLYDGLSFWTDEKGTRADRIIVERPEASSLPPREPQAGPDGGIGSGIA
jgi:sulfotransferase